MAEKSAKEGRGYCSTGEERESTRGRRERVGFPEMETLNPENAIYSKFLPTFVDHNFSIRTPICVYFASMYSV